MAANAGHCEGHNRLSVASGFFPKRDDLISFLPLTRLPKDEDLPPTAVYSMERNRVDSDPNLDSRRNSKLTA